jgi:hypothetical protein
MEWEGRKRTGGNGTRRDDRKVTGRGEVRFSRFPKRGDALRKAKEGRIASSSLEEMDTTSYTRTLTPTEILLVGRKNQVLDINLKQQLPRKQTTLKFSKRKTV